MDHRLIFKSKSKQVHVTWTWNPNARWKIGAAKRVNWWIYLVSQNDGPTIGFGPRDVFVMIKFIIKSQCSWIVIANSYYCQVFMLGTTQVCWKLHFWRSLAILCFLGLLNNSNRSGGSVSSFSPLVVLLRFLRYQADHDGAFPAPLAAKSRTQRCFIPMTQVFSKRWASTSTS